MRVPVRGIALNVEQTGDGPPLLLLHGFMGSSATWDRQLPTLSQHFRAICVDLIGHGMSDAPADPERYRMEECVADLLAILDHLGIVGCNVLGYSMGGRVALHLAVAAPSRVGRLVLESASPGLADPSERQQRVAADNDLAIMVERDGVASFVEYWESQPLFASQRSLSYKERARLRQQRLRNNAVGLANSLRGMGAGAQRPLWDDLRTLFVPTLLIVGSLDVKYVEVGSRMVELLPEGTLLVIPQAGHAVHIEQPDHFNGAVLQFLLALGPRIDPRSLPRRGVQ